MTRQFLIRFDGRQDGEHIKRSFILPKGDFYIGQPESTKPCYSLSATYIVNDHLHLTVDDEHCLVECKTVENTSVKVQTAGASYQELRAKVHFNNGDRIQIADANRPENRVEFVLEVLESTPTIQRSLVSVPQATDDYAQIFAGLFPYSVELMKSLPEIYQSNVPERMMRPWHEHWTYNDNSDCIDKPSFKVDPDTFLARYLGIFESVLLPVSWTVDNFEIFLSPLTAPTMFLPWFEQWFGRLPNMNDAARRRILHNAPQLKSWQGTKWGLSLLIELFTGRYCHVLESDEQERLQQLSKSISRLNDDAYRNQLQTLEANFPATHFVIVLPDGGETIDVNVLTELVERYKPAHTSFQIL